MYYVYIYVRKLKQKLLHINLSYSVDVIVFFLPYRFTMFYHGLDMFLATSDASVINGRCQGFFTISYLLKWYGDSAISCDILFRSTSPESAPRLFLQILAHSAGVVASKWSEWEQSSWKQPRWMPKAPKFTNKPRPCNDLERLDEAKHPGISLRNFPTSTK